MGPSMPNLITEKGVKLRMHTTESTEKVGINSAARFETERERNVLWDEDYETIGLDLYYPSFSVSWPAR